MRKFLAVIVLTLLAVAAAAALTEREVLASDQWDATWPIQNATLIWSELNVINDADRARFEMPGGFVFEWTESYPQGWISLTGHTGLVLGNSDFVFPQLRDRHGNILEYTISGSVRLGGSVVRSITFPEGVTIIFEGAFAWDAVSGDGEVIMPRSLVQIDSGVAFYEMHRGVSLYATIVGHAGSYAETWARNNFFPFRAIAAAPAAPTPPPPPPPPNADPVSLYIAAGGERVRINAFSIDGSTYVGLRDLAVVLGGTPHEFDIVFDGVTGTLSLFTGRTVEPGELSPVQDEPADAERNEAPVLLDGTSTEITSYRIGGSIFIAIRPLGEAIGLETTWNEATGDVIVSAVRDFVQEAEEPDEPPIAIEPIAEPLPEPDEQAGESGYIAMVPIDIYEDMPFIPAGSGTSPGNNNTILIIAIAGVAGIALIVAGIVVVTVLKRKPPQTKGSLLCVCGSKLTDGAKFCVKCGAAVK